MEPLTRAKSRGLVQVPREKKGLLYSLIHQRVYWLMLIPSFVFFILFMYLPMVGVYIAFTRYDYGAGIFLSEFIGFQNFYYLFGIDMPVDSGIRKFGLLHEIRCFTIWLFCLLGRSFK